PPPRTLWGTAATSGGLPPGGAACAQWKFLKSRELPVSSDAIRAALVQRLRISSGISHDGVSEILALPISVKQYAADRPVVSDGQKATDCCLIADGFCAR